MVIASSTRHPVISRWLDVRFPDGPTLPQRETWPLFDTPGDILVAAPTGSGKTLTAFVPLLDQLWRREVVSPGYRVLYLSPLRALATDIRDNLVRPLEEMTQLAMEMGEPVVDIRVDVRTGDTDRAERDRQRRKPGQILVTTPETLAILMSSDSGRESLRHLETVVIDEIHALCRDKRGSHMSLALERLDRFVSETTGRPPRRVGLSATQKPLSLVANFLSGHHDGRPATRIVDATAPRHFDLDIMLPGTDLDSIMSQEQFADVLTSLMQVIIENRTTLIFVGSRRFAERLAYRLAEQLENDGIMADASSVVAAHHGSLAHPKRKELERRLKAGELKALVATASLELGIDVGPVDMVCQIGSSRSIATFLQRIGRANHRVGGTPRGRLYPLTRSELIEMVAMLDCVQRGELDAVEIYPQPLDVMIQHLVGEVGARGEDTPQALMSMVRRAHPYRDLSDDDFAKALELTAHGITLGHGVKGAHLFHDDVNQLVRPRRSARMTALNNSGTIPDTGDYAVVVSDTEQKVGAVSEEFAVESSPGDIFVLGSQSWRIERVETGKVRVSDAGTATPTVPIWFGESPARSVELSQSVARLYEELTEPLAARDLDAAMDYLTRISGVNREAARQVAAYVSQALQELGSLPARDRLVVERFFDETGSAHLVVHSPRGARVNRALGLAMRKKFCVTFDFELQAAADDDAFMIALGPHHSFTLDTVMPMVRSYHARDTLVQAVLLLPMLQSRWRWNCGRSFVMRVRSNGAAVPINIQRMAAVDLMAAVWPSLAACQENAPAGPVPVPDHVLVRQTVEDVLHEPLDIDGLMSLLAEIESGVVTAHLVDRPTASVLSHGIVNGKSFTFLDDTEAAERRSREVYTPRGTAALGADGLPLVQERSALEPDVVTEVMSNLTPLVRSSDELAELIRDAGAIRAVDAWEEFAQHLVATDRLLIRDDLWIDARRPSVIEDLAMDDALAIAMMRSHLQAAGPVDVATLIGESPFAFSPLRGAPLTLARAKTALAALEADGFAIVVGGTKWCARFTWVRCNEVARRQRRASYPVIDATTYLRFMAQWQGVHQEHSLSGRDRLAEVLHQLAGFEVAAGEWDHVLASRVADYRPEWLDELCLSGEFTWARLSLRAGDDESSRGSATPSAVTPVAFFPRRERREFQRAVRLANAPRVPEAGASRDVYDALSRGAAFRFDLPDLARRLPPEVDEGVWDLVARGLVHADAFAAVRSLLRVSSRAATPAGRRKLRDVQRASVNSGVGEGRWDVVASSDAPVERAELEELAELVAVQLLERWGIVCFDLYELEAFKVPWREVLRALRRLEVRGEVIGARVVTGVAGEQFIHPRALALLREQRVDVEADLSTYDPLNFSGLIVGDERVAKRSKARVHFANGVLTPAT